MVGMAGFEPTPHYTSVVRYQAALHPNMMYIFLIKVKNTMRYLLILVTAFIFNPSIVLGNEYKIKTNSGITVGYIKNSVVNWDDIPYAQPPVGDLRWRAPRKVVSSEDLNIKPQEDNFCIQEPSGLGGSDGDSFFSGTEDCLS